MRLRPAVTLGVALAVSGCARSSGYINSVGNVLDAASLCKLGACPEPPKTYAVLQGRVLEPGLMGDRPVPHVRMILRQDGRQVATSSTDGDGRFRFTQTIPDGSYDLVLDSNKHRGHVPVVLDGCARTVDVHASSLR